VSENVATAVASMRAWGEACDWRGYDPYDALNSPLAPALTLGTRLGRRLLTQAVKLSPLNLRPLLGIERERNAKAIGLVAAGYIRLAVAQDDEAARDEARRWLDWLATNHAGDETGLAWGYHFDVQTRFFAYKRGTPNTIATSFVAQAFLDGVELLGEERWAEPALAAARYLEIRMLSEGSSGSYFRYLPRERELVHNANLLACAVLARAGRLLEAESLLEIARRALRTSLAAQREDGSWPYAEGPDGDWVDNFHTSYVLESLAISESLLPEAAASLDRGLDYWESELFLADGTPKYFPDRVYPLDVHCYATAIDTWLAAAERRSEAIERADRIAALLIERMLDSAGFAHFQKRRFLTNRTAFVRWTTAPSFRALAELLLRHSRSTSDRSEGAHAHLD